MVVTERNEDDGTTVSFILFAIPQRPSSYAIGFTLSDIHNNDCEPPDDLTQIAQTFTLESQ